MLQVRASTQDLRIDPRPTHRPVLIADIVTQGADLLAHAGYQVYIPDFFHGEPYSADDFPPDTPEKGAKLGAFFQGAGAPPKTVGAIPSVVKDIESKAGGKIEKWGVVGMCWGGKVRLAAYTLHTRANEIADSDTFSV